MGKTPTALVIEVALEFVDHPDIQALAAQGHTIRTTITTDVDLILHPAAHRWLEEMWESRLLDVALKGAQAVKRSDRRAKTGRKRRTT